MTVRYVVYGTGAVGGVIGAHLQLSGTPTTLVARGHHLKQLQTHGLLLDTAEGAALVDAPAVGGAGELTWTDDTVVLLCVKSHQTAAALDDLVAHAPAHVPVVSVQNGVVNEAAILRHFEHTYSVCVMLPAAHVQPGVIVQRSWPIAGILDVGKYPSGVDSLTAALSRDLAEAGFSSCQQPDIMAWKYRKLVLNLANGVVATCRPGGEAFDELMRRARDEGEAAIAAAGISCVTDAEDSARRGNILQGRERTDDTRGGSTWQSLARGARSTEIDYLAGEIILLGRLHGVPTPVNSAIQRATTQLASSGRPPASLDPGELLAPGSSARESAPPWQQLHLVALEGRVQ